MPVKVEQINEYLFSDFVISQKQANKHSSERCDGDDCENDYEMK